MRSAYGFQLRAMRADDLGAVLAVQAACYPPSMQEAVDVVAARLHAAGDTCVVAEDADGVCGYLFAYRSKLGMVTPLGAGFTPPPDADTLYLHDLSVAPHAHGRGVARNLVDYLLARAEGMQASALVSVQDTVAFWSALGYRAANAEGIDARAALGTYPGQARYMVRPLTGPGAPSPNC